MKTSIGRRTFLRGTGTLLPLPSLNMMRASASTATNESPPTRFLTLFKPNGVHPPSWNINAGTEHDFRMSPLMKPFEKHKDDLLILDNMGDFGFSSHKNSTRRFLSGHHENTKSASVDQLIADKICGDTPHRSMELTTEGLFPNQFGCSYISYDRNGAAIPRESDPQLIFDRLFRNPAANPQRRRELADVIFCTIGKRAQHRQITFVIAQLGRHCFKPAAIHQVQEKRFQNIFPVMAEHDGRTAFLTRDPVQVRPSQP